MKKWLLRWVLMTLALVLAAGLTSMLGLKMSADTSSSTAILRLVLAALALGFLNATVGTVAKLIALPLNCLTLGLVSLFINAGILYWVGTFKLGLVVGDFLSAFVGSLFYSGIATILTTTLTDD